MIKIKIFEKKYLCNFINNYTIYLKKYFYIFFKLRKL